MKKIAGHDLFPCGIIKNQCRIRGTGISVPYVIITGALPGPVLTVTAGIHNAEFVGIQAVMELSGELDPCGLTGTVVMIPLANVSGFESRTMSMVAEDGKNLNRVFPGDADGSAADRLAYTLFHTFLLQSDAYIDLHSGDGFEELTPYVYYLGDASCEEKSAAMASCVNTEYCVRSSCRTGGAYNLASLNGIPSVLIERGQLSQFPRSDIEADKNDVLNIMRSLGMLPGSCRTFQKGLLREQELFSPATGCWYPALHAGDHFSAGDELGTIRDYFGNTVRRITSEESGVLLHQCAHLNIIKDGPMLSYGTVTVEREETDHGIA